MDPVRNPFAPGAGTPPPELSGREELLARAGVMLRRVRIGRPAKGLIAVGLRGVGKTVLLQHIRRQAEAEHDRACFIEMLENRRLAEVLVPQLRRVLLELDRLGQLNEQVKRGLRVLRSFMSAVRLRHGETELALDIEPEAGTADSGDIELDLPDLLAAVGRAAAARQTAVVLLLDELQYLSQRDLSALIMAIHRTTQEALPVVLVGAGLPQLVGLSGRSKSYAERLFDFPSIEALSRPDAIRALDAPARQEGVTFTDEALDAIVRVTRGYPYFLQAWGYQCWNTAPASPITAADAADAAVAAVRTLDEGFFRVRFDRLTPREKDYLRAMADAGAGPHRSGEIAERLGMRVQNAGPLRTGLIAKGMIYGPTHGDTAFTVPLFDEFLRRIMPDWNPPRRLLPGS